MTEPIPPIDPRLGALLREEAKEPFSSEAMAARIRAGVMAKIAGSGPPGGDGEPPAGGDSGAGPGGGASGAGPGGASGAGPGGGASGVAQATAGPGASTVGGLSSASSPVTIAATAAAGPTSAATIATGASLLGAPLASLTGALTVALALALGVGLGRLSAPPASPQVQAAPRPATPQAEGPAPTSAAPPGERTLPPAPSRSEPPAAASPLPSAARTEPTPRPELAPRAASKSDLAAEQALLDRARVALSRGLYTDAMAAVRQHAAQFPAGALSAERAGLEVLALAGSGAKPEAETAARRYIERYPDGVMIDAVRAVLEP